MTLTQRIARVAIRLLTRLAEDPEAEEPEPPDEEDALPWQMTPTIRAELRAEAIARQARHPYRPMTIPKPPDPIETDSHLRYSPPKPKPRKPRKPRT